MIEYTLYQPDNPVLKLQADEVYMACGDGVMWPAVQHPGRWDCAAMRPAVAKLLAERQHELVRSLNDPQAYQELLYADFITPEGNGPTQPTLYTMDASWDGTRWSYDVQVEQATDLPGYGPRLWPGAGYWIWERINVYWWPNANGQPLTATRVAEFTYHDYAVTITEDANNSPAFDVVVTDPRRDVDRTPEAYHTLPDALRRAADLLEAETNR